MKQVEPQTNIREAERKDLNTIKSLLDSVSLPSIDIESHISNFLILEAEGIMMGTIGLEIYDKTALLRSLAVKREFQGKGYGQILCRELLSRAGEFDIENIFLLTETAKDFFTREGFQVIEREAVPDEIKRTNEYSTLCPSDSTCMFKRLQI
ncbi:MAG: arsenic resistance N-acetyltransferase ArsN2 [Ignavibacteria bacterium]|jgi:amino-acid N-acetyltransferase